MSDFDVIVVGGGLAGLRAALAASKTAEVALVSKVHPIRSHSGAAQGGINAALADNDSWEAHAFDTVKGSDYLADQDAVEILCKEAPAAIHELDSYGVLFSRTDDGRIAQRPFGGAGFPRTCYAEDRTGHNLLHSVYQQCVRNGLNVLEEWFVTKVVAGEGAVQGLVCYNILTGEVAALPAKAVVLATGGYGRTYARSTNAHINTGDGAALALRAGAALMDMEFVQFHPTTLLGSNILISEAARGEGGRLLNAKGERFMARYAADAMELAPRDIVARSIQTELNEGRGVDGNHVDLELMHLGEAKIKERLPGIRDIAIDFAGIDPIEKPVPVQPGQHYSMGGIAIDTRCMTEVVGLLSAGESACLSVHGANRLGGNSLLETIVFGRIAGESAAQLAAQRSRAKPDLEKARRTEEDRIEAIRAGHGRESAADIRAELKQVMTRSFQIFRTAEEMQRGFQAIETLKQRLPQAGIADKGRNFNKALVGFLELENMILVAETVAVGALARKESRGSHFRTDFPKRDDSRCLRHSIVTLENGNVKLDYRPVRLGRFPVKERTY